MKKSELKQLIIDEVKKLAEEFTIQFNDSKYADKDKSLVDSYKKLFASDMKHFGGIKTGKFFTFSNQNRYEGALKQAGMIYKDLDRDIESFKEKEVSLDVKSINDFYTHRKKNKTDW